MAVPGRKNKSQCTENVKNINRSFAARQSSRATGSKILNAKSATNGPKSVGKNSVNSSIFLLTSNGTQSLPKQFSISVVRKNSTSHANIAEEKVDDFISKVLHMAQNNNAKALEYASETLERAKSPHLFLEALTYKVILQLLANKTGWDDDFIATVKNHKPDSFVFRESWERLLGALTARPSYDSMANTFFEKAFQAFPNNFIVTLKRAEVLLHFAKSKEAVQYLKNAIELDPHRCRPWAIIWKLNPTRDEFLKKAIECPDSKEDTFLWSEYATKQIVQDNNVDAGIESLKKAIEISRPIILPGIEAVINNIAVHLLQKDAKSAEKVLRIWVEESPLNAGAWSTLGSCLNAQKRVQEAEKCYRKAVELDPKLVAAWFNLGNLLPAKEAIPILLHAIKLDPNMPNAHYRLALHYRDLEQNEKALEAVNKALSLQKHSYYVILKAALHASLKQYKEEFSTAREFFGMNAAVPEVACNIFEVEERFEEGLTSVRDWIKRDPKNHTLVMHEASFLAKLNRVDEALRSADKAIELARETNDQVEYHMVMKTKALILARSGNLIEAKQLAEVLRETGDYPLAIVARKEGNFNEALRVFNALSQTDGGAFGFEIYRYSYFSDIADVYAAKGDLQAAERYLNLVVQINPDARSAKQKLNEIKTRKTAN